MAETNFILTKKSSDIEVYGKNDNKNNVPSIDTWFGRLFGY
jgi:hypothetical protein